MISTAYLAEIANYTNNKISKVVINSTVEITDFIVKNVNGSLIGMQYIVPSKLVSLVTKIDLITDKNQVISTNNVYIPIISDTLMLHTFLVKEVE